MIIHSVLRRFRGCITVLENRCGIFTLNSTAKPAPKTKRRAASKEQRREQLIRATIKCIARKGLSKTTMADVTTTAKLSQGIVNLHFQSKEKLLVETLRYVASEYKQGWDNIIAEPNISPTEKIRALIDHDFKPDITRADKLAVWFAFWGESSSRPVYRKICQEADLQNNATLQDLCVELGTKSSHQAKLIATGYTALVDGLWLDMLVTPDDMDRLTAHSICANYMASFFPAHFSDAAAT